MHHQRHVYMHTLGILQLLLLCSVSAQLTPTAPPETQPPTPTQPPPLPLLRPGSGPALGPHGNATPPVLGCTFEPALCQSGAFHLIQYDPAGCPADSCRLCTPSTGDRPQCRGVDCPDLVAPRGGCPAASFLNATLNDAGCPALDCAPCTPELAGRRPGCSPCKLPGEAPVCPSGQFVRRGNDSHGCPTQACASCPVLSVPVCPAGAFVESAVGPDGCPKASCAACTAETSGRPECRQGGARGCTDSNRPECPGRRPVQQLMGTACHWVCEPCPPDQQRPANCPAGQFMRENPASHCQPWTCRDCDFQHRDLPACRPPTEFAATCPQLDWARACTAGQYRRAKVTQPGGCLAVECASCADAAKATADPSLPEGAAASAELPAECRRPCPEPLVLCGPGTTVEFGLDADGCRTAACRLCRDQETCGAAPACASRQQLDHEADDCRTGYFHLGSVRIDGCAASVCLPCPAAAATAGATPPLPPPGCQQLPAACAAATRAQASSNYGLPNCTTGAQRVEQVVDAAGCPRLACAECPASRPACPAGTRESPRPTKWLQCQLFDCRRQLPSGESGTPSTSLLTLDAAGCPVQRWRQSPLEFGTELLQLEGGCRLRRYRTCPAPGVACRWDELPQLTGGGGGTCEYACQKQNWTTGTAACFPGQHYLLFVIDTNRAKSPFQIRFQVASFIARLAGQLTYGPQAVLIGALCYSGRVLSIISPDECATPDAFFRRLLLLRYDEDSATATGLAVAAAADLLKSLKRPMAGRSVIVMTDSPTSVGRSLRDAAALLPADTATYFVSLSSVWNPSLRAEAESFVSEPGNLVELTSYYLLATSGVQLLFPQCYSACDSARNSLTVYQSFLRYLQDSVHGYEAWLYDVYATIAQLQEGLGTMQYQFESKQIRLELCSRMIVHYKATVQRLQDQLDSLQVMRTQAINVVDYESSLTQVKQLEQRLESLTVRLSQQVTQLQETLVQISSAEDRVLMLRKEQEEKLSAEDSHVQLLEKRITESWKSLQTLTQELLLKRMTASSVESMVQEKETRIQDVLTLNSDLATRISSVKAKIVAFKTSTNSSYVASYVKAQANLTSCEARAALDGFSPLLTIRAGANVRIQEVADALLRGASYRWKQEAASQEMEQYTSLLNFTVGTYSEVKLLFRNSAGQTRAYLTFRTAAFDLADFFSAANLVSCFPWRLETVKEALDLSWSLRSDRFPSLLFSIMATTSALGSAASSADVASRCARRTLLLALVTDKDGCEDLPGPYPRMRFSPSGQPTALTEMEDLDSLQLLVKSLATRGADPNWLPGLVASADMPVTLAELLGNGMLTYPAESAPAALRPGTFYKSLLLRSRPTAFPVIRLRLTDASGRVQLLAYNGTFERDRVVESTWSGRLLAAARVFAVNPPPFGFTIGDGSPCNGSSSSNATGLLYFNLDNRCPAVADPVRGWSVLVSPETDRQVPWSQAERAVYVEIHLRRRDSLASAAVAAAKAA